MFPSNPFKGIWYLVTIVTITIAQIPKKIVDRSLKVVAEIVTGAKIKRAKGLFKPPVKKSKKIN